MEQEAKLNAKEILTKLAKLQADVDNIKSQMKLEEDLKTEMKQWEGTSAEDSSNFLEKYNL